jgi:hypothetical protein
MVAAKDSWPTEAGRALAAMRWLLSTRTTWYPRCCTSLESTPPVL